MELFTPDSGLIFWMFVSFAVLFFVLWKWGWPVIMKGVSDRADLIDKGVEYAQNAKQQLDHAREEADKYIADARRQQADMMREAIRQLKRREGVLIVLDEADKLSDQVLHFFITIYNKLEDTVGIVLCATQYLKKRIERGVVNNRKGYKEIYSRIGRKFIPMPVVNRGDIKAVCTANGLEDRREIERIIDDADNDLRRVKRLVCALKLKSAEG